MIRIMVIVTVLDSTLSSDSVNFLSFVQSGTLLSPACPESSVLPNYCDQQYPELSKNREMRG